MPMVCEYMTIRLPAFGSKHVVSDENNVYVLDISWLAYSCVASMASPAYGIGLQVTDYVSEFVHHTEAYSYLRFQFHYP